MVFPSVGRQYGRNCLAGVCSSRVVCPLLEDDRLYNHPKTSLPHCYCLSFLLRETIPKAPCEEISSLDIACHIVGNLYIDQDILREAEDMLVRALAGKEKALGPEHTSTLDTVNNLGVLYSKQGKLREAEDMYVRALAGYEKALGPEHNKVVRARRNIALLKNTPKSKTQRIISRLFKKDKT